MTATQQSSPDSQNPEEILVFPHLESDLEQKVQAQIEALVRATREEIKSALKRAKEGSVVHFFLSSLAERGEEKEEKIDREYSSKDWGVALCTARSNTNKSAVPLRRNDLTITRRSPITWVLESSEVVIGDNEERNHAREHVENLHNEAIEIAKTSEDENIRSVINLLAHQHLGLRVELLQEKFPEIEDPLQLIKTINEEIFAENDIKIHVRNGIAILGLKNVNDKYYKIIGYDTPETRKTLITTDPQKIEEQLEETKIQSQNALQKAEELQESQLLILNPSQINQGTTVSQFRVIITKAIQELRKSRDKLQLNLEDLTRIRATLIQLKPQASTTVNSYIDRYVTLIDKIFDRTIDKNHLSIILRGPQ